MIKKKTVSYTLHPKIVENIEVLARAQGLSKSEVVNNTLATNFALEKLINEIQILAMQLNEALQEFTEAGL